MALCGQDGMGLTRKAVLPKADWDPKTMPLNCTAGYAAPGSLESRAKQKTFCRRAEAR